MLFSLVFLGLYYFFSKSNEQIAIEYGFDPEELALYSGCNRAVTEGKTRFFSDLSSVEGCACLVSRMKKKNYLIYAEILNSMAESGVRNPSRNGKEKPNNDEGPSIDDAPTLVELKVFTDFAANAEYCATLN